MHNLAILLRVAHCSWLIDIFGAEIKGIGPKIVARIDEILQTNTLEELDDTTPNTENLQEDLIRITGVGPSKAESLLQKDITF